MKLSDAEPDALDEPTSCCLTAGQEATIRRILRSVADGRQGKRMAAEVKWCDDSGEWKPHVRILCGHGDAKAACYIVYADGHVYEHVSRRGFFGDIFINAIFPVGGTVRRGTRLGRNEPCPCGSGKKAKRCCGTEAARR